MFGSVPHDWEKEQVEAITSERAVELACRLGNGKHTELVLVHVIVVPFTLPLNAPMPEEEKNAHEALELGGVIARRYGCHAEFRTVRHRSAARGVLQVAEQDQVDAIVLRVGLKNRVPGKWGKTSVEILRRSTVEVLAASPAIRPPHPAAGLISNLESPISNLQSLPMARADAGHAGRVWPCGYYPSRTIA